MNFVLRRLISLENCKQIFRVSPMAEAAFQSIGGLYYLITSILVTPASVPSSFEQKTRYTPVATLCDL